METEQLERISKKFKIQRYWIKDVLKNVRSELCIAGFNAGLTIVNLVNVLRQKRNYAYHKILL